MATSRNPFLVDLREESEDDFSQASTDDNDEAFAAQAPIFDPPAPGPDLGVNIEDLPPFYRPSPWVAAAASIFPPVPAVIPQGLDVIGPQEFQHHCSTPNQVQDTLGAAAWASVGDHLELSASDEHLRDRSTDILGCVDPARTFGSLHRAYDTVHFNHGLDDLQQPWNAFRPMSPGPSLQLPPRPPPPTPPPAPPAPKFIGTPPPSRTKCLGCKRGRDACVGSPLCNKCAELPNVRTGPFSIVESPLMFLNYELGFSWCKEPGQPIRGPGVPRPGVEGTEDSCNLILELDFDDLQIRRDISNTHMIVCDLRPGSQGDLDTRTDDLVVTPRPRYNTAQSDRFVLATMWRPLIAERRPKKSQSQAKTQEKNIAKEQPQIDEFSEAEQELFTTAQLIVGYYSLLRNLDSTWTNESALQANDGRFALAEFTYLLIYRISFLVSEFSSMCPRIESLHFEEVSVLPDTSVESQIKPAILLYAVEILFLGIESIKAPQWNLGQTSKCNPLRCLERELEEGYYFLLRSLSAYQCRLSALHGRSNMQTTPGVVDVVRTVRAGLPKNLVIGMQRHIRPECVGFNPFPYLHTGQGQYSVIDILAVRSGGVASATWEGIWTPRQRLAESWVTEDNSLVEHNWFNVQVEVKTCLESDETIASVGYPHTTTFIQGVGPLKWHPDPPKPGDIGTSIMELAGLHLGEGSVDEQGNDGCSLRSLSSAGMKPAEFEIPEPLVSQLYDSDGQRKPDFRNLNDFRPKGETVERPKRKHAEDNVDGDAESEASHPKRHGDISLYESTCMERLIRAYYSGAPFSPSLVEECEACLKSRNHPSIPPPSVSETLT